MWMVRAGEHTFLIDEFIKNNIVAIGWDLGDLSEKSDDEIKELFKKKYKNLHSIQNVLRFKNKIEVNDYVISLNWQIQTYFIGKIKSEYKRSHIITQKDSSGDNYFDIRDVEWLGEVQRDALKKSTQKNVGTNSTVFKINDYAKNDILNVCKGNMDAMDNASCIIRKYLDKNNLNDLIQPEMEDIFIKFKNEFAL